MLKRIARFFVSVALLQIACSISTAAPVNRFDVVTFCCDCPVEDRLCQPQFDALNWKAGDGHYLAMGSDEHRAQVTAAGNELAVYYDVFNDGRGKTDSGGKGRRHSSICAGTFSPKPVRVRNG